MEHYQSKSKIKSSVKEALSKSTSHGIPNIVSTDKWSIRLIWIVSTLLSTALCGLLIAQNFLNYYEYEVTTKIREKYDYVVEFPSVTVCNFGRFSSEYGYNFSKFADKIRLLSNDSIRSDSNFAIQYALSQNLTEIRKFGDSLSKLVKFYKFESRPKNLSLDFTNFFSPYFTNCYIFNPPFYEDGTPRKPTMTASSGVVFVHEFGSHPLTAAPIFVLPQKSTYIGIKRRHSTQLPKPYSSCDEATDDPNKYDSEIYKAIHNTSFKYSQSLCIDLCFQKLAIENCSCFYYVYALFPEGRPCLKESEFKCVSNFYACLMETDYLNKVCLAKCPLECSSTEYIKSVSTYSLLDADLDEADITVFLEDYVVTEIEEAAVMDVAVLLSNIGGIAGLFLGVSFLSFIEILACLAEITIIFFRKGGKIGDYQNSDSNSEKPEEDDSKNGNI
ncbi:unnamed protein product [Brachionus calyciflorus]|uniref:Uncharacterized protein n=1 Tax=Brachionus calyciflorus TaxID=104777 RepID=A0A813PDU7_9BILA|nr:unnamed protein product [Brachionus calyciflorus]